MTNLPPPPPGPPSGSYDPPPPGGSPKAHAKAAKAYAKASRPWYKKKRFIFGGLLAIIVIVAIAGGGGSSDDKDDTADKGKTEQDSKSDSEIAKGLGTADASGDVELTSCGIDEIGWGNAEVKVTNSSSKRSNYFVTVAWESSDGKTRHGDGMASAMNIDPGQTSTVEASLIDEPPAGAVCKVIEVQRTAA